ncbi:hypothetical protein HQN87_16510 [Paenibacillus tritici]|uniref:Bacterial toxin 44 domain-containing protein n=1 Tax=Paenibacillus tritici TaxID=1873425 RepID=A0ABX2DQQ0_9BACL|nr:polymorphic toxin type 44 domain-containing protein [Paenibacillus tritici]NQX46942.1 hypothetical protein [Paenibacillus tritici]
MKKIFTLATLMFFLISSLVSASPQNENKSKNDEIMEIHQTVVSKGLAMIDNAGKIAINTNALQLGVDEFLFNKYLENMDSINFAIEIGGIHFDKDFNVKIGTKEEVIRDVFEKDQERTNELSFVVPFSDPGAPPTLSAYNIAYTNRNQMINYYQSLAGGIFGDPEAAYSATFGYWVARVQAGGAWDYKSVPGYTPYYKQWTMSLKYNNELHTSEWFGNYNYGFTGSVLFSLSALYAGADGAGYVWGNGPDDAADRQAVNQGNYESQ